MSRSTFGGTDSSALAINAPVRNGNVVKSAPNIMNGTAWSSSTAGTQYADLVLPAGGATTVRTDANGFVMAMQGPDGVNEGMWVDLGSGVRFYLRTTDPLPFDGAGVAAAAQAAAAVDASAKVATCAPLVNANALATGESTLLRTAVIFNNGTTSVALGSGSMRGAAFTAVKTETITQVRMWTSTVAAAATPTLCRIGVYSIAANDDLVLLASTVNDISLFAAANTSYTRSLSASFAKVAGQRYVFAVLVVTAVAMPTFVGVQSSTEIAIAPRIGVRVDSQADLPTTFSGASLTNSTGVIYGVVLP